MKSRLFSSAICSALVLAGCAGVTPNATTAAPTVQEQAFLASSAITPRYAVMTTSSADATATATVTATATATTTTVVSTNPLVTNAMAAHGSMVMLSGATTTSSSERSSFFALKQLTDGNLHSAWGASASDTAPTLTFDLKGCTTLRGLGIKQSGDAKFDVAVQVGTGAWTVIGTDLTSTAAMLDWVDLKASSADRVQLRFHGDHLAKLLVCEVQWFGDPCDSTTSPSPTPSATATASATPTATPSATPTATPTAQPSDNATPTPMPSATTTVTPTATPTPMPSDNDGGTEVDGSCTVVIGKGNRKGHHLRFGCEVRHHNKGKDEGSCQLVDVDTNTTVEGTIDHCSFHGNVASCVGHTSAGESFSFELKGGDGHRTCSFHGANVDFDDETCANVNVGDGLRIDLVAAASAWLHAADLFGHH